MLCRVCIDTLEGTWDPSRNTEIDRPHKSNESWPANTYEHLYGHHRDLASLKKSATNRCMLCRSITPNGNTEEKFESYYSVLGFYRGINGRARVCVIWESHHLAFDFVPLKDLPATKPKLHLDSSTGSDSSWNIAMTWLDRCVETHDASRCLRNRPPNFSPTRLLELKRVGSQLMFSLKENLSSDICYMTLSHCWGKGAVKEKLRLLRSTFRFLREMHPVESLPKTFREACRVTERIGVRYLWIDRLCIIQDCKKDWNREAALMQDVYKNSFLNISAHGAGDDEDGLFFNRDPREVDFSVVDIRFQSPTEPEYFSLYWDIREGWEKSFEEGPVVCRGWIIQERLLAPRVLHFGREQLFWECNGILGCESRPHGLDLTTSPVRNPDTPHIWKQLLHSNSRGNARGPLQQAFLDWTFVVGIYSGCQITFPKDRLVALSGLANNMKRHLRDLGCKNTSYFAGLWAADLLLSLAWGSSPGASRPSKYRAPSWSWASIEGPVFFCHRSLTGSVDPVFYSSFLRAKVETIGRSDTGQVSYGKMVLKGHLALGERSAHDRKRITRFRDIKDATHTLRPAEQFATGSSSSLSYECSIMFDVEDDFDKVYCLPIFAQQEEPTYWEIVFLVLTRKGWNFTRIGCLRMYTNNQEEFHSCFQQFQERKITLV